MCAGINKHLAFNCIMCDAERDDGGVISNRQQSKIGQRVYMRCDYTGEIKWFFMRNPQLPNRRPQAWGKTLNMMSNEHDSGFYICMGSRGDNRTYISKVFLEVLSKLVIEHL